MTDDTQISTPIATHTSDGFTVGSNSETAESIESNFAASAKPKDGPAEPEKSEEEKAQEKVSEAASELGKRGAAAAAEKRAAEKEAAEKPEPEKAEAKPEAKVEDENDDIKKPSVKKRIEEKAREAAELRRERDQLRAQLDEARRPAERPAEAALKPGDDPEPKESNFTDYKDFVKAQARWEARQEFKERDAKSEEQRRQEGFNRIIGQRIKAFEGRMDEAEKGEGFKEAFAEIAPKLHPSFALPPGSRLGPLNVLADEVLEHLRSADFVRHFYQHPEDLQRFAALESPRDVIREMAKLESRFDGATAGTRAEPATSKAKPPVRPVTTSPQVTESDVDDNESLESHLVRMNARDAARRRSGARKL